MVPLRSIMRLHSFVTNNVQRNFLWTLKRQSAHDQHYVPAIVKTFQFDLSCNYAKQSKTKAKVGGKGSRVVSYKLTDEQLRELVDVDKYQTRMEKAITLFQEDCIKHLSARSTVGNIETIIVNVDGKQHQLQDIAQIHRKPKMITMNMVEFPDKIKAAMKALAGSGLNLNPQQDGCSIFIPVVKVTKDHRLALVKNGKALFTKCRDEIKKVQADFIRKVEDNRNINSDDSRAIRNQLIGMADEYVAKAEGIFKIKENELLNN